MIIWEVFTEGAHGDVTVRDASRPVPSIVDVDSALRLIHVQPGQQKVDEIVRRDGTHVPLEPAQHQQLPLLFNPIHFKVSFILTDFLIRSLWLGRWIM